MGRKRKLTEAQEIGLWAAFHAAQTTASDNCLKFSLTFQEFADLVLGRCFFCGAPGKVPYTTKHFRSSLTTLDRLHHYTPSNAISICGSCEKLKKYINQNQLKQIRRICTKLMKHLK